MVSLTNYYFLIAAFPPLVLGSDPSLSFREVQSLLALNLTAKDMSQVELLLRPVDLYNIRALWLQEPLDDRGNFNTATLEEALLVKDRLPLYLVEFLDRYESTRERLRYFSSLYASFYREELSGFLGKYNQWERQVRLVLTALRAKRVGRDVVQELQFEDPTDLLVADILAQKEAPDYTPHREFEDLKTLFTNNAAPQKLHRAILEYRFHKIEEMEENQDFGIDRVLAYVARLMIAESFMQNKEKGKEQLAHYE